MNPQRPPSALREDLEVAAGLCRLDQAEAVRLTRYIDIRRVIAGHLQEHTRVRAALVGLTGRVQKAWAEAEAGGEPPPVADRDTELLQCFHMRIVMLDVGQIGRAHV